MTSTMKFCLVAALGIVALQAQDMPADYQGVLKSLERQGDYKANVLKVNIPRSDLKITVDGVATPTHTSWIGSWPRVRGDQTTGTSY